MCREGIRGTAGKKAGQSGREQKASQRGHTLGTLAETISEDGMGAVGVYSGQRHVRHGNR